MSSTGVGDRRSIVAAAGPRPVHPWIFLHYDTQRFPFAEIIRRDVFKVPRLERLHEYVLAHRRKRGIETGLKVEDNLLIRKILQDLPEESALLRLYHEFIRHMLAHRIGRSLSYTNRPKMRVHFPGTPCVSTVHHDIIVTKRIDQINFWLPFNDVDGSATLWLESDYGAGDYAPVGVRYGQVLIFDGGYLGHGSVANDSQTTRVSLDMRFSYKSATTRAEGVELMNRLVALADQQTHASEGAVSGLGNWSMAE